MRGTMVCLDPSPYSPRTCLESLQANYNWEGTISLHALERSHHDLVNHIPLQNIKVPADWGHLLERCSFKAKTMRNNQQGEFLWDRKGAYKIGLPNGYKCLYLVITHFADNAQTFTKIVACLANHISLALRILMWVCCDNLRRLILVILKSLPITKI
jgi:hypothetical protein